MLSRSQSIQTAIAKKFDLIVIGGGIAGAGIALDAAARGLSVVLVEKRDFGSGTSSKTTKLIHGGLRYLEQFQFKLVRELCMERAVLQQLAPHMVQEFDFVMPLLKSNPWFSIKAAAGLTLYDALAWSTGEFHPHAQISQQEVLKCAPALSARQLSGGLRFHDCITDDTRMVIEVLKSACSRGAVAINYLEVTGFEFENGKASAAVCRDHIDGKEILLNGQVCINAAGVWSDEVSTLVDPKWKAHLAPSKGIHIIVPSSAFETNSALFLHTQDERYVFVVPWHGALMIGTTDTAYKGSLDKPLPNLDEIDYLLSVVNSYTSSQKLNRSDITGSFAGLRPLVKPAGGQRDTSNLSRDYMIIPGPGGIVNLIGGKLTNFRIMAQHLVDDVMMQLPHTAFVKSPTRNFMLGGWVNKQNYLAATAMISAKARRLSVEPATLKHLLSNYGVDAQILVDLIEKDPGLGERICPDFPFVMAEIPFCIQYEMVVSLEDLLMRRLRLAILNQKQCIAAAPKIAQMMQAQLQWDNVRLDSELQSFESSLDESIIGRQF